MTPQQCDAELIVHVRILKSAFDCRSQAHFRARQITQPEVGEAERVVQDGRLRIQSHRLKENTERARVLTEGIECNSQIDHDSEIVGPHCKQPSELHDGLREIPLCSESACIQVFRILVTGIRRQEFAQHRCRDVGPAARQRLDGSVQYSLPI